MTKQKNQNEAAQEPKSARRELLGSGTLAAAGALFGMIAVACGDDDDGNPSSNLDAGRGDGGGSSLMDASMDASSDASSPDAGDSGIGTGTDADIALFNALLSNEYQAIAAYTKGADLINQADATDPLHGHKDDIVAVASTILAQHMQHADALVDAITELNGTPVNQGVIAAAFTPPADLVANPTISNVLKFAASKEKDAAVAYNNTIGSMEAASSRFLAASIEGDETQHFIVLAALVLGLVDTGTNFVGNGAKVIPEAFVHSFNATPGLDNGAPTDYYA